MNVVSTYDEATLNAKGSDGSTLWKSSMTGEQWLK